MRFSRDARFEDLPRCRCRRARRSARSSAGDRVRLRARRWRAALPGTARPTRRAPRDRRSRDSAQTDAGPARSDDAVHQRPRTPRQPPATYARANERCPAPRPRSPSRRLTGWESEMVFSCVKTTATFRPGDVRASRSATRRPPTVPGGPRLLHHTVRRRCHQREYADTREYSTHGAAPVSGN